MIAHSLQYVRPAASDRPYPLKAMCTHPIAMSGFTRKEFMPGKLKPEYALMNKIIHDRIGPKGNEKFLSKEELSFI